MVLGETLSAVKKSILREMGERILGWESDDLNGWGYPPCVMESIPDSCGYTKKALVRQIGPNATLLLAAKEHCVWHDGTAHGCSDNECKYVKVSARLPTTDSPAGATTHSANPAHYNYVPRCVCKHRPCDLVGPDMHVVHEVLRRGKDSFPVFEVEKKGAEVSVAVKDWVQYRRGNAFATVSHVWSQGLGNPKSNKIHKCQLLFIKNMLVGITKAMATYKPMSPAYCTPDLQELRHQSIRHIYDVFDSSSHSLVIDDDLCTVENNDFVSYDLTAAIKLLTSTWMRRLWTLQEAFLSKEMCFPEQIRDDKIPTDYPGRGFDQLIRTLETGQNPDEPDILEIALAEVLKRHLFENLMGHGREARVSTGNPADGKGSRLISSAWRSARWRTSAKLAWMVQFEEVTPKRPKISE
ncbi:uncharacterized protein PG998_006496 [Apiospora kogelbergensis]|uniref:uncharacterized protein n=1 Tax=Apiospora kogelbergensis TaxID=1337665 RepID=UPI003130F955